MESVVISTADGFDLEGVWSHPTGSQVGTVVFCHPHPLHGGTMTAPLMERVTEALADAGMAVLRFNFRGVGASGGHWAEGIGEINDVAAAMAAARDAAGTSSAGEVSLVGWSFGAATALRYQARDADVSTYVGIAPPVQGSHGAALPSPDDLRPGRRTIIIGERDQLIDVEDVRSYAADIGSAFHVLAASDHFFHFREQRVAEHVLSGLGITTT